MKSDLIHGAHTESDAEKYEMLREQLQRFQQFPLSQKVRLSKRRIQQWYNYWDGKVYVSFSGGKDSTALLHLVRSMFPGVPAVFVNTGLEFPEIVEFIKTISNVIYLTPKTPFTKVLEKYGYPIISKENAQKIQEIRDTKSEQLRNKRLYGDEKGHGKLPKKWHYLINADFKISHKCCDALKKRPVKAYEKETGKVPIVGSMAFDSAGRSASYIKKGCNSFSKTRPMSTPIAFWKEENIWEYIHTNDLSYSSIYDKGYDRTGCMWCMFGVHLEKGENRFQRMKKTHPKQWNYCINKLGCGKVLNAIGVEYGEVKEDEE